MESVITVNAIAWTDTENLNAKRYQNAIMNSMNEALSSLEIFPVASLLAQLDDSCFSAWWPNNDESLVVSFLSAALQ